MAIIRKETNFDGNRVFNTLVVADTDPTVSEDLGAGYKKGAKWINQATGEEFVCVDSSSGAAVWQVDASGACASAQCKMATNPTATNTLTIGADVFEFVAAAGDVAADVNIAVEIKGSAELTLDELINAINAVDANNQHPTIFLTDSTTPALANGTEAVLADKIGTTELRIRSADKAGGQLKGASPSIVLAEALTDAADIWDVGNVNLNTLAGNTPVTAQGRTSIAITAAMVTAGNYQLDFPFIVAGFVVSVRTTADVIKAIGGADKAELANDGILLTLAGGGIAEDINATDVVEVFAWS